MNEDHLQKLAVECAQIAKANGFDVETWENMVAKLAFVITELDEARDGALGYGDDPLGEELADTAIRLLVILQNVFDGEWKDRITHRRHKERHQFHTIEEMLWPILGHACKAIEDWRHDNRGRTMQRIEFALLETFRLADVLEIDLLSEIADKCDKNRERAQLHGKAHSLG